MENERSEPLLCPFCGAPQRGYVPADTLQLKCQYCGGVFLTKPSIEGEMYRCGNHPQKLAVGTCNDCARSFCGDCLRYYRLETQHDTANLYLCPECLRRRYAEKADTAIYGGLLFLFVAFLLAVVAVPMSLVLGVLVGVFGVGMMVYGYFKRAETPDEMTISELREGEKRRQTELVTRSDVDAEELYGELTAQYATRWGAVQGIQTLNEEIGAYIRHGESFEEAVQKIYRRQKKRF